MLQDIYVLTKWNIEGELNIASNNSRTELPIYFSQSQAEYFFNFAETRITCLPGEEVVLLKGQLDVASLSDGYDLLKVVSNSEQLKQWKVIAKKEAVDPRSPNYRSKVIEDLKDTRNKIVRTRKETALEACG